MLSVLQHHIGNHVRPYTYMFDAVLLQHLRNTRE